MQSRSSPCGIPCDQRFWHIQRHATSWQTKSSSTWRRRTPLVVLFDGLNYWRPITPTIASALSSKVMLRSNTKVRLGEFT